MWSLTLAVDKNTNETFDPSILGEKYRKTRFVTEKICQPLQPEDTVIQSMKDVSPPKWHLGHTSWFFEAFLLIPFLKGYTLYNKRFNFIFNSYYEHAGERIFRENRRLLSRPLLEEVFLYRKQVDKAVHELLNDETQNQDEIKKRIEIGIHHEQQHQELLLTDIKHIFFSNPLYPIYRSQTENHSISYQKKEDDRSYFRFNGGLFPMGGDENKFGYDNEFPRHKYHLEPFFICTQQVTNEEYLMFIEDGGYKKFEYWLSDGWDIARKEKWESPLYWFKKDQTWYEYHLNSFEPLESHAPVCHVSFFEADAFARWSGKRLPTEFEWEFASKNLSIDHENYNFFENGFLRPIPTKPHTNFQHLLGNVWEWTNSSYLPYPGFKPLTGALGEYNGKFMNSQRVLRGGSCATARTHIRSTYRNFFPPNIKWQFSGIRLADNL